MDWLHYSFPFFSPNVCQNVSQSEPSKTTLLPEGASDGFVNNFDQLKGEKKKNIISIIHFSETVNFNLEGSVCLSFLLPPSPPTKQST